MTHKTCDQCGSNQCVGTFKVPPQTFLGNTSSLFQDLHFQGNWSYDLDHMKIHVIDLCAKCQKSVDKTYTDTFQELISQSRKEYPRQ